MLGSLGLSGALLIMLLLLVVDLQLGEFKDRISDL